MSRQPDIEYIWRTQYAGGEYVASGVPFVNDGFDGVSSYALGMTAVQDKAINLNMASVVNRTPDKRSMILASQILTDNNYLNTQGSYKVNENIPAMHVGIEPILTAPGMEDTPTQYVELEIYVNYDIRIKVYRRHNFKVPAWAGFTENSITNKTVTTIVNNLETVPTASNVSLLPLTMGGINYTTAPAASGQIILANRGSSSGPPNTLPVQKVCPTPAPPPTTLFDPSA